MGGANIDMAWNTAQMQQVLDHWAQRRGGSVPPELIGRIAPTRTEPRASTCVGYSDSRSSATSIKSYRLSLPKKRRREAREKRKQSRDLARK
jgi:hypothetical protein